jgi:hypothetical protein
MFENGIVWLIVGLSVGYLIWQGFKSLRGKAKGHCSGCGKE